MYVGLLTGGYGGRESRDRGIRRRRLIRRGMDDLDGAFAHRHFHSCRPQVDIERRADGPDPIVTRTHPKRPLRIMGYFEKGLAAFETNDTPALAVVDSNPAVGIEIERGAVRQCHCGLLT